jgi:hypothetical protein
VEQNGSIIRKEFSDIVEHIRVYAVSTLNKIKIIKALQAKTSL